MRTNWRVFLGALIVVFLTACSASPTFNQPLTPIAPMVDYPLVEADKTTVVGLVRSQNTNQPMTNTTIRLAKIFREQGETIFVLDGADSPGAITNDQGIYVFANIPVEEYVMVVGDVFGQHVIIPDESGKVRIWQTQAGEVVDMGEVVADLP